MPGFSDYESLQEFKDRLNCLTEKLKNTSRAQVKQEKSGQVCWGLVRLQFRKANRLYKHKTYQYERVSLNFPAKLTNVFLDLRDKEVKVAVTKQAETYWISLTEENQ